MKLALQFMLSIFVFFSSNVFSKTNFSKEKVAQTITFAPGINDADDNQLETNRRYLLR